MSEDRKLPRILRIVAALYPRSFRQQYGEGFSALLQDERTTLLVLLDLLLGAVDAHLQAISGRHGLRAFILRLATRTFLRGIYGLVAFPLGVAYFVFIVTGASLGGGLLITLAGLPILALTIIGARYAARFERWLTSRALEIDLPAPPTRSHVPMFQLQNGRLSLALSELRGLFFSMETFKSVFYLMVKFPFSVMTFASILFLGATGSLLLSAPIAYQLVNYDVHTLGGMWSVHSLGDSILPAILGAVLLVAAAVAINVFAWVWGLIARTLLVETQTHNETLELAS